jgi:hypothetical protein
MFVVRHQSLVTLVITRFSETYEAIYTYFLWFTSRHR